MLHETSLFDHHLACNLGNNRGHGSGDMRPPSLDECSKLRNVTLEPLVVKKTTYQYSSDVLYCLDSFTISEFQG